MPVNIKGKTYFTVAERIESIRKDHEFYSITTELLKFDVSYCVIKAMVSIPWDAGSHKEVRPGHEPRVGTGMAMEEKASSFINGTSYVENCETSAIGRALASIGYGGGGEFCSADELANAITNQGTKNKAPYSPPNTTPTQTGGNPIGEWAFKSGKNQGVKYKDADDGLVKYMAETATSAAVKEYFKCRLKELSVPQVKPLPEGIQDDYDKANQTPEQISNEMDDHFKDAMQDDRKELEGDLFL